MEQNYTIRDVSLKTDLSPFIIIHFLQSKDEKLELNNNSNKLEVSPANFIDICMNVDELKVLERIEIKRNQMDIEYLNSELYTYDLIYSPPEEENEAKSYDRLHSLRKGVVDNELEKAINLKEVRDFLKFELTEQQDFEDSDEWDNYLNGWDDNLEDDEELKNNFVEREKEYNIYNSMGYVSTVYNLRDAREMANRFNGRILDEYKKEIH